MPEFHTIQLKINKIKLFESSCKVQQTNINKESELCYNIRYKKKKEKVQYSKWNTKLYYIRIHIIFRNFQDITLLKYSSIVLLQSSIGK